MWEGQLLGWQSLGGRCGAASSLGITGTACVNGVGGPQRRRQAAPQLCWEELGWFGARGGRLTEICRDPWRVPCLSGALHGPGTAAHHHGAQWCLSLAGVECVLFNEEYMTCTWGSRETLTANYSLYYWYENRSPVVECKHYLWDRGVSIGCHFNQSEIIQFQPFHVLINASLGGRTLEILSERMELQDLVKPEAPVNLTIRNMSSNQLQLTWRSPYPKAQCLEHAVKYKSNKDTSWTEQRVKGDVFSFPSVDYEKYYTFYVRSKINSYCGSTQLWSEWSVPVVWGSNSTSKGAAEEQPHWFWIHRVLIPIAACLLLLVLVVLLVRMERVWVILMPRIPNPSKNFDELFITHNGNFQEWAGVPKDVVESFRPNYSENICYVSELPPKDSYEPLWESNDHPPSAMPGAPAAP
ncbi:cytokine receptor common subunit gamma isoform X1 [Tyto alba]|uniref:cytokine receptor common subunit gamma isoform X1 n=1 Tax=Tyto alba TaxID=56313 RepID=UPI001404220B|nr:cytokine receptor common subunit gamma isoform X1 [Tyto alba]